MVHFAFLIQIDWLKKSILKIVQDIRYFCILYAAIERFRFEDENEYKTPRKASFSFSFFHQKSKYDYHIYSINRPGRLLKFFFYLDSGRFFQVCAYSRQVAYSIFLLFSSFSASLVCLFCEKTINGNNKTRRCNKDSRFCKLFWRKLRLRGNLLLVLIQFQWVVGGRGWALINVFCL